MLSALHPAQAEEVMEIFPRPGVTLRLLVDAPPGAKAVAILFAGGHGRLKIRMDGSHKALTGNFLVRSRKLFSADGFVTVLFDAPSDHMDKTGLASNYRMTPEHAGDIRAVIKRMREKFALPVWLVGTSRGSTSAANGAATPGEGGPDGLVLTSAIGVWTSKGGNVLDFDLGAIKIPVLVVHHRDDGCRVTPFAGAEKIKAALKNAKASELMVFEGGGNESAPCQAKSHHGYLGIEGRVVGAIAAWIKAN